MLNQFEEGGVSRPGLRIWFSFLTDDSLIFFNISNPKGSDGISASGKSILSRVGGELSMTPGLSSIGANYYISSAGLGLKGGRIFNYANLFEMGEDAN